MKRHAVAGSFRTFFHSGARPGGRISRVVCLVATLLVAALWLAPFPVACSAQEQKEVSFHGVIQDRLRRPPSIRVGDVIVDVSNRTVIHDRKGNPVKLDDLQLFQEVTVTGFAVGDREIAARKIVVTPPISH